MKPISRGVSGEGAAKDGDALAAHSRLLYAGDGSLETLCRSVMGSGELGFFAMRSDGVIVFVNAAMGRLIGRSTEECIGRNVVEWLHPDDLERAASLVSVSTVDGPPPGMSRFLVAHASGQWVPLEISGATAWDGNEQLLAIYCRNGAPRLAIEEVMTMLLRGLPLAEVMTAVCNVVEWGGYGTQVAISWFDGHEFHYVSTGVPGEISGATDTAGTVWERARSTGTPVLAGVDDLDESSQAIANGLGISEVWVVPVTWRDSHPPATITIWTVGGGRSPQIHASGMEVARNMVELILRWADQQAALELAASNDPLTGLANRRVFFRTLNASVQGGAVLYCDLDRFKPVNDTLGHAAGDQVLQAVAERIGSCVRSEDLVARIGGDEFAVLCEGASPADATEVANRIQVAFEAPFVIDRSEITVGVSIGIAYTPGPLDAALVDAADSALAEAKAAGRATYRVAT